MILFLRRSAVIALTFVPVIAAQAAYNPAVVSADARWVVFADFNGLRASTLGKEFVSAVQAAQSQATGGVIGLDVPKLLATVGTLTAYGTNFSQDPKLIDGTLVAQGTADLRKIVESVLLQGTLAHPEVFTEVKDLPFPAYAIADPNAKEADKTQVVFAFPSEPIVVISKSKAQLQKARDVFRGAAPSLAKTNSSPLAKLTLNAEGAYLFAASLVPTEHVFPENAPQARILQLANSGSITFGERGPETFAHAELIASSDANAEKLMKILQGMTAVLSLAESNDKQLAEFLNSTNVSREKDRVTLHMAYATERLVQMTQALRLQMAAKPAVRQPTITIGTVLAEWGGNEGAAPSGTYTGDPVVETVENVKLTSGVPLTIGRAFNGGKNARFVSVEITPAGGGGAPMVFKPEFMRNVRGSMWQFQFPGVEGVYNFKVTYVPDPEGKTKFALSMGERKEGDAARPPRAPAVPEPKWK